MLYMLGAVTFEVQPVNLGFAQSEVGADYAIHEVIGARKPREYGGPTDTPWRLEGRLFPSRFGWGMFEVLKAMAEASPPQMLIRGDGAVLGWMDVLRVRERHSFLDQTGVGRIVDFEVELVRSPSGADAMSLVGLVGGLVSSLAA